FIQTQNQGGTALEKASSDSPLTRCDLVILHRLDVCPVIAHWRHSLSVANVPIAVVGQCLVELTLLAERRRSSGPISLAIGNNIYTFIHSFTLRGIAFLILAKI
ncbi:MAG: hypothetical protein ACI9YE_003803, partial [Psychroserpens sp.]